MPTTNKRKYTLSFLFITLFLAISTSSCTSMDVNLIHQRKCDLKKDNSVDIIYRRPPKTYMDIGDLSVRFTDFKDRDEYIAKMKKKASTCGADTLWVVPMKTIRDDWVISSGEQHSQDYDSRFFEQKAVMFKKPGNAHFKRPSNERF